MFRHLYILVLTLTIMPPVQPFQCRISTLPSLKKLAAECEKQDFREITKDLDSDIQLLSYHHNYVLNLEDDSFAKYKDLEIIYLDKNSISAISSNAFANLNNLDILDLSFNSLKELPQNLPRSLRTLNLDENRLIKEFQLKEPIFNISSAVGLKTLRISACKLIKFPKFDKSSANLKTLNITSNEISRITPDDLAPLCSLNSLVVDTNKLFRNAESSDEEYCECLQLQSWIDKLKINITSGDFTCRRTENKVPENCDMDDKNSTLQLHNQCIMMVEEYSKQSRMWSWATYGVIGIVVLLCVIIVRKMCFKEKSHRNSHDRVDASRALYGSRTPPPVHMRTIEQNGNNSTFTSPHANMCVTNEAFDGRPYRPNTTFPIETSV